MVGNVLVSRERPLKSQEVANLPDRNNFLLFPAGKSSGIMQNNTL